MLARGAPVTDASFRRVVDPAELACLRECCAGAIGALPRGRADVVVLGASVADGGIGDVPHYKVHTASVDGAMLVECLWPHGEQPFVVDVVNL